MEPSMELAKVVGPLLVAEDGEQATITSQATLFLARDLTGKEVVLKRTTARSREQLDSAQNEVSLLRKIRHPNVVAFSGVWFRPLEPYGTEVNLLMELCPGGHLLDLQRRREKSGRPLTEQEIVRLFVQCCRGVECLHRFDPPVAHRDVKLENLLLGGDDGRTVKLCDFGSATTRRTLVTTKEERARLEDEVLRLTTPSYRAPELVDFYSKKLVSEQVDIWALGCVLYALAYGKHAFGEEGSTLAILSGKFTIPLEPYYSPEFKLLFFWLLEGDPNIRPRIGDVVDELDLLLGNRIKIPAEKRGSGCGSRSSTKIQIMEQLQQQQKALAAPPPAAAKKKTIEKLIPPPSSRGAAFVPAGAPSPRSASSYGASPPPANDNSKARSGTRTGAMESRRANKPSVPTTTKPVATPVQVVNKAPSNNPFDDLPPSLDPTFFSTPGMSSTSVAGFPEGFPLPIPCPFDMNEVTSASFTTDRSRSQLSMAHGGASTTTVPHATSTMNFSTLPPSQAPIFFSDPPPQWRTHNGL